MILPLEDQSLATVNDRLRTSQVYPGAIARSLWVAMQSPTTKDGMLYQQINFKHNFHASLFHCPQNTFPK